MKWKQVFSLATALLAIQLSFSQVVITTIDEIGPNRIDTTDVYGRYRFPHIESSKQGVADSINADLLFDMLGIEKDSVQNSIFENVWKNEDFPTPSLTYTNYNIDYNQSNILSLSIETEFCSAYCEADVMRAAYDTRTGKRVEIDSLFIPAGMDLISLTIAEWQRNEITTQIQQLAKKKTVNKEDAQDKSDAIAMYNQCIEAHEKEYIGSERIDFYHDFIITPTVITIFRYRCSPHYMMALDALGEFEYTLDVNEYRKYLTPYGLDLFNIKK